MIVMLLFIITRTKHQTHLIDKNIYPEMDHVFSNRHKIRHELDNLLASNKWSKWSGDYTSKPTPIFSKMTDKEIINRIKQREQPLNSGDSGWKLYSLILNKNIITDNAQHCPATMKLLQSNNIINAGFSCIEPNFTIDSHRDFNKSIVRCHIPLIIPIGDCALQIEDEIVHWNNNDYFIFDDTMQHKAWNKTDRNRIVLIIDLQRR